MPVDDKRLPSSVGLTLMLLFLSSSVVSKGNRGERVKSMENRQKDKKESFFLFSLFKYQSMKESERELEGKERREAEGGGPDSCHWISCESE